MNTVRLARKTVVLLEDYVDLTDRIHADGVVTPDERHEHNRLRDLVVTTASETDASLAVGMYWIRGGMDTRRSDELVTDYEMVAGEPVDLAAFRAYKDVVTHGTGDDVA